jgi:biopolymer transport protein ExbB/TolQ
MDPGWLAQVAVIVVVTASALATVAVIALRAVRWTRRLPPPVQLDERLEHLQQSVDAISIEVERIAEAQRFSAKLLAGRAEGSAVER